MATTYLEIRSNTICILLGKCNINTVHVRHIEHFLYGSMQLRWHERINDHITLFCLL